MSDRRTVSMRMPSRYKEFLNWIAEQQGWTLTHTAKAAVGLLHQWAEIHIDGDVPAIEEKK